MMEENKTMLEVRHLKKYFPVSGKKTARAVDDVSFLVPQGKVYGIVGESGCGKTTIGKIIAGIYDPTEGEVLLEGKSIFQKKDKELAKFCRKNIQMVFQDPYSSLNPKMCISKILEEPFLIHEKEMSKAERQKRVSELLEMVGLPQDSLRKYPHEFSGGQRQRIVIARALALNPKLLICDEPVSALDVSIQGQILKLLEKLQAELGITVIFIAHGLHVVKYMSDRIGVLYLGRMVEEADSDELFYHPGHPYTEQLMASIPEADPNVKMPELKLEGELPSILDVPKGCCFCTRCPYAKERCFEERPQLQELAPGHKAACFFPRHPKDR